MAWIHVPVFVLAPHGHLPPSDALHWPALVAAQAEGVRSARRLRIYPCPPAGPSDLEGLVQQVRKGTPPFCNALVPGLEIGALSLGVYDLRGETPDERIGQPPAALRNPAITCLDELPLAEVANEACWFYPTETGTYLACDTPEQVQQQPGYQPERSRTTDPLAYRRDQLRLLWSLLGGDEHLTCVGLTYGGQRIDWPVTSETPAAASSWTWFAVDSSSEQPYRELERQVLEG
ncbi:hypothetical protein [Cyanobium sp. NIES-981]|uniref:hypothetical protein n=1 Tax=Cyanobium sp. NIES-981 TaxID=1851505 RepID=UPI0012F74EA5|nr:hypothetical protein [Cyanobium sp. NIES-981]